MKLFNIQNNDTEVYQNELRDFLPDRIIDIHTHVWLERFRIKQKNTVRRTVSWPSLVASDNPMEHLLETYQLLFPGKQVTPLVFSSISSRQEDFAAANAYIAKCNLPALLYARPDWDSLQLEKELERGRFLGIKVYLSLADMAIPKNSITIFDFLPHCQLEVMNNRQGIVMLHVPRDARIRDPLNVAQILIIAEKYPDLSLIIAHAGRAYCEEDMGDAFDRLSVADKVLFDISANTNSTVFASLISKVGPQRILFGSDLPITRMRMKRICENGRYINLVGKGLYGDVSHDSNMREVAEEEAKSHTFFLYEELLSFKRAARENGLKTEAIKDIFFGNAVRIIKKAGGSID